MSLRLRGRLVVGLAAALLVAPPGPGRAEDQGANGRSDAATKKTDAQGRASGVIVKIERVKPGASSGTSTDKSDRPRGHRTLRLTINTAAVWRDWARDRALQSNSESSNKAADEGANSVASKGEPQDEDTLVVVDLTSATKVETRFRTPEDETRKGSKTPEAARGGSGRAARDDPAKPTHFAAHDLKPGLFVEVDFRHKTGRNRATTVCVIRPVSDTGTTRGRAR
jgi:hypothetical protein